MNTIQLWFLQDLEEIIIGNKKDFGKGKNSWYNLLLASVHTFIAGKFLEREKILQDMKAIYDEEEPVASKIGFVLPSKKKQHNTLEFGLQRKENVEKMRPIRQQNQKLNDQLAILRGFAIFIYSIDPKSKVFDEKHFEDLLGLFQQWLEKQIASQPQPSKEISTFDENGEVPASQRSGV